MATIKQIKDTAGNVHDILSTIGYGTCATAAATAAKVATISDTSWTLKVGSVIGIKFTNTNTAGSSTTPVTLNVNSTGAKNIWYDKAKYTSTSSNICGYAGRVIYYMYDGTYWVWMNCGALDGNSNTVPCIQIETAAATAAKAGTCTNYSLLAKSYAHANIRYSNTSKTALTLNVNGKGAKPIYINGTPSSSSNYTLPAGTYIIYYDGSNYHFRTDGVLPGKILNAINAINDENGNNIMSTYTRISDFDSFTSYAEETYTKSMLSVRYSVLVNLRDSGNLIPGQQYRITDYVTTTADNETQSAGHQFDIIVTANSNNTLSEIASACLHEGDTYFSENGSNLSAWQIWYCLDNDNSRFEWATGYSYDSDNNLYEFSKWITGVGKVCDEQIDTFYETEINEKFSHFGYSEDLDGIQRLTLYGRNLNGDIDEGLDMSQLYHYKGVYNVDGKEYDGWAQLVINDDGSRNYATASDGDGNPIYVLTERIVYNEEIIIGKGVIYRMIDEWGNDCPYDFKNIKFLKPIISETDTQDSNYYYTFCYYDGDIIKDASIYGFDSDHRVFNNVIKQRLNINGQYLNRILFIGDDGEGVWYNNTFDNNCFNNIFGDRCHDNTFGEGCYNNILRFECYNNTFGKKCYGNIFGNSCYYNTLGNDCYRNIFGNECYRNTFGHTCSENTLCEECFSNTLGDDCSDIEFGDCCYSNTLGNECYLNAFVYGCINNSFGNSCRDNTLCAECCCNTFGNNCSNNSFGDECYGNILGDYCNDIIFVYYCYGNIFGNNCYTNHFGEDCNNNKFGNNCYNNTFGDEFDANSFGNDCSGNEFGDDCYSNSLGNRCTSNHFGKGYYFNSLCNDCRNNTFGTDCYSNKFGNSCCNNTLGNDCNNNTLGEKCEYIKFGNASSVQSFYRNIIIDNGNKYIYLYAIKTRSSDKYYQNVRIGLGVNNSTTYKTIADSNDPGQTYETWYRPSNSQTKNV